MMFKFDRRFRGQALTEFALITPLCMLLILGGYDLSIMGTDTGLSVAAVRHAARSAAELGGTNNDQVKCTGALPASTTLAEIDASIVQTVLSVTSNITYMGGVALKAPKGKPEEIDIYRPDQFLADGKTPNTDGTIDTTKDLYEKFTYIDNFSAGVPGPSGAYTLLKRCQGPLASDSDIGVRLIWTYKPANGIPGPSFTLTEYAVERLALCSDNCNP